jgi:hypothetical protein
VHSKPPYYIRVTPFGSYTKGLIFDSLKLIY